MNSTFKSVTYLLGLIPCLSIASMTSVSSVWAEELRPAMVIIIDDLGYNLDNGLGVINLPGPITLAVMPHTPYGALLARQGADANKEIMLHVPMASHAGFRLGPGGLTLAMKEQEFKRVLKADLASIPRVEGFNNHMGSALTEEPLPMQWTMDIAKELNLFFVDSLTSAKSVASQQALSQHVPTLERDVFLDNDTTHEALAIQFKQAMNIAHEYGFVVLIGHPYPATVEFLNENLPKLDEAGIMLVSASSLIKRLKPHLNPL